jgi:signal transduction histidine kinase
MTPWLHGIYERPGVRAAIDFAVLLAIYLALEWVSDLQEFRGLPVTAWNPGLGVLFAAMARGSRVAALALFVGTVTAETIVVDTPWRWEAAVIIAGVLTSGYATMAAVARALRLDPDLERVRDVGLLLSVGLIGAVLVSTMLVVILASAGALTADEAVRATLPLVVGDMIGIAVVTPLVLRSSPSRLPAQFSDVSFVIGASVAATTAVACVWFLLREGEAWAYQAFYVVFLPVVFAALRNGLDGACLTLAATQIALVGALNAFGYDATAFTSFQAMMTVVTATGLLAGAVSSERDAASRAARIARARLKEKESEAARADRFHLVTGLASALSHEINQPMTAARAYVRTAQRLTEAEQPDVARVRSFLDKSVVQIDHAGEILRSAREFLRRGDTGGAMATAASIVADTLQLIGPLATQHRVKVVSEVAPNLPPFHCERIQIQQVLVNLVGNAIEALTLTGRSDMLVTISVRRGQEERIEFAVRDNGPGVDPAIVAKLFEPMATTKAQGLGLGLAISAGIVEAHGGRLWLENAARGATEFRFWIPASGGDAKEGDERDTS